MTDLVTLQQAKDQLRVTDDDDDAHITSLVTAASSIVVSYLKTDTARAYDIMSAPGTSTYPPPHVQTAALLVVASLYVDREGANDPIGIAVASILWRDRDPALA